MAGISGWGIAAVTSARGQLITGMTASLVYGWPCWRKKVSPVLKNTGLSCYNRNMKYQAFRKKLSSLNKTSLETLILGVGLSKSDTEILLRWYVREENIVKISTTFAIQRETAYNKLSSARRRLFLIINNQEQLLPSELQYIIRYLTY